MFPNELNSMEQDSRSAPIPVASGVDPGAITGSGIPFVERHPIKLEEKILLLPVDEGFDAWSFLVAAFIVEAVVIGLPNAFGVFLAAYLKNPVLASQKHASNLLPLIGTVSSSVIYFSGPVSVALFSRFPHFKRPCGWIGMILICVSLLCCSFTTSIPVLILLQGVMYAIGGALMYGPCIFFFNEWFVERRGFASGVMFAGAAAGGLVFPLLLAPMIHAIGLPWTFRALSIALFGLITPSLRFMKGRLPDSSVCGIASQNSNTAWMKNPSVWLLMAANTVQGFAYFIPIIWLPTFASVLGLRVTQRSLTVALLNGASVFGGLVIGFLSDRVNPWILGGSTLLSSALVTFVLWGILSNSLPFLVTFSIAYGSVAGGWPSLWVAFIRPIAKDDPMLMNSLFGYLGVTRGLGNILSTPIATALRGAQTDSSITAVSRVHRGFDVGGGEFKSMIIYTGTCFAGAAALAGFAYFLDFRSRKAAAIEDNIV